MRSLSSLSNRTQGQRAFGVVLLTGGCEPERPLSGASDQWPSRGSGPGRAAGRSPRLRPRSTSPALPTGGNTMPVEGVVREPFPTRPQGRPGGPSPDGVQADRVRPQVGHALGLQKARPVDQPRPGRRPPDRCPFARPRRPGEGAQAGRPRGARARPGRAGPSPAHTAHPGHGG
jgi:hypothetical protein